MFINIICLIPTPKVGRTLSSEERSIYLFMSQIAISNIINAHIINIYLLSAVLDNILEEPGILACMVTCLLI